MYINDFRDVGNEEEYFEDPYYIYELETYDLPYECPYRQIVPRPPFGSQSPQGPSSGPQQQGPHFQTKPLQIPPTGHQEPHSEPTSPPPGFAPAKAGAPLQGQGPGVKFVEPGALRPCTYRFIYIWPRRGRGFWAWLTFVGRRSVTGFRWNGRRWVYFGMDLRNIESFQCY